MSDDGLIESDKSRPYKYKAITKKLDEFASNKWGVIMDYKSKTAIYLRKSWSDEASESI